MRIGTWNLDGSWSSAHASLLQELRCDVLLLTECPAEAALPGFTNHATSSVVPGTGAHWAVILSTTAPEPLPDPHPASAAALIDDVVVCASVLPWPLAGDTWPWGPDEHLPRMRATLRELASALTGQPAVWGGDWNQPLTGSFAGFTRAARDAIVETASQVGVQVPTASQPGRRPDQGSIDHLAVPTSWTVRGTGHVHVDERLSDHDAYWVEADCT